MTNDPFAWKIMRAADDGPDKSMITICSTFDPTAPTDAAPDEVRAGLRHVAAVLGRLGALCLCEPIAYRRRVRGRGLIDPTAVLRGDDPLALPPSVPTLDLTVRTDQLDYWRRRLRENLAAITEQDEWKPSIAERSTRMVCAAAPERITVEFSDTQDRVDRYIVGVHGQMDAWTVGNNQYPEGEVILTTYARVIAMVRHTSGVMGRMITELAGDLAHFKINTYNVMPEWEQIEVLPNSMQLAPSVLIETDDEHAARGLVPVLTSTLAAIERADSDERAAVKR